MNMQARILAGAMCLMFAALVTGCGDRKLSQSPTYPVKGKVLYNGEPARYVIVRFEPTDNKGVEASGRTDQDGIFELRTYSNDSADGAVPGTYKVIIEVFNPIKAGGLPRGAKPTKLPKDSMEASQQQEVRNEDNDLDIQIP
jgi:hypothetical protein